MATPAQIAANRANALKSTGPRTAEGKQRSSLSALKHGLTAHTLVLPHEDTLGYGQLRESMYNQYQPATEQECMVVDQLTASWWRTIRVRQIETDMLDLQIRTLTDQYPDKENTQATDRQALAVRFVTESERDFVNFMRYDAAIERSFYRALNTLEKLQAARRRQEAAGQIGFVSPSRPAGPSAPVVAAPIGIEPPPPGSGPAVCGPIGFVPHSTGTGTTEKNPSPPGSFGA